MIPFQTGQHIYDIVYGGSYWIGDWAPHLAPVRRNISTPTR